MESIYTNHPTKNIQPNVYVYTSLLQAYANLGKAIEAEKTLNKMNDLYTTGKNIAVKPNVYAYTSVIKAWAYSKIGLNACLRAEAILGMFILCF